ncbi:MAG: tRNA (adenosine(37)-N6)-threonylcarbamoyltransferase complex ATPase subunit type 1 TsaE [Betaproteobacteria bacterium]|nr:tRNA (adenosine(37)-N6)-threonylcarbamoyltransferase complex ATPase subunit type 1 TsaE [Betaproteobacteria bacterium]
MSHFLHEPDDSLSRPLADESATRALGAALAPVLETGLTIYLRGDLGAGKTTLVRGLLESLGHAGPVRSPTYTLIEPYVISKLNLYHFDFYRFTDPQEFLDAGLEEYFAGDGVCLVEWPEQADGFIPAADIEIHLEIQDAGRQATLIALNERGRRCLKRIAPPPQ